MKVTADKDRVFYLLDTLLERWTAEPKRFPYNHKDSVLPQDIIPKSIRSNKTVLACFYFYICIYMRGGIKSLQAFNALIKMWEEHPDLFNPLYAQWLDATVVQNILKEYIGWDSKAASISWVENSRRLVQHWGGSPLNLIEGLEDYTEALRRIRNKLTKRDLRDAGADGQGFRGFQPKMVSMILYFYDWEGWLNYGFLYPAPADFHNFRLAFAHRGLVIEPQPKSIRVGEKHSTVWREVVMQYLQERGAESKDVADAIWLFSLVMCGSSPLTQFIVSKGKTPELFDEGDLPLDHRGAALAPVNREALKQTCLSCPIATTCELAIPAGPYYQTGNGLGGKLFLWPRRRAELSLAELDADTTVAKTTDTEHQVSQSVLQFTETCSKKSS